MHFTQLTPLYCNNSSVWFCNVTFSCRAYEDAVLTPGLVSEEELVGAANAIIWAVQKKNKEQIHSCRVMPMSPWNTCTLVQWQANWTRCMGSDKGRFSGGIFSCWVGYGTGCTWPRTQGHVPCVSQEHSTSQYQALFALADRRCNDGSASSLSACLYQVYHWAG